MLLHLFLIGFFSLFTSATMQVNKGDGNGGKGVVLTPRNGEYSNVVFFFHGLGDTADGWSELSK